MGEKQELPSVTVIMSTYNGEKYIKDQIDSLLAQKGVYVRVNVRDDGSIDNTIRIVNGYNNERIKIFKGENIGPAQSFLKLLKECEQSDYYAYCDQDDVWKPRKLTEAIQMLDKDENKDPALYMSTYDIVDQNLDYMFTFDMEFERPLSLQETIMYRAPSACTMVFNHKMREKVVESTPKFVRMHDFWTLMIAEAFHYRIVTDNRPQILYRQHSNSTVSVTPSMHKRIKRLLKSLRTGKNERMRQAVELYKAYGAELPRDSLEILEEVINYRDSFDKKIRLLKDKRFSGDNMYHDLLFKLAIITGKF